MYKQLWKNMVKSAIDFLDLANYNKNTYMKTLTQIQFHNRKLDSRQENKAVSTVIIERTF